MIDNFNFSDLFIIKLIYFSKYSKEFLQFNLFAKIVWCSIKLSNTKGYLSD